VIPILHLRQGTALYGADRAVLALSASTPKPYLPIVGAIARPGTRDALAEEAHRRGLAAVRFDSARRFDLRCARAVARLSRERGVRLLHAHDFKALFIAVVAGLLARVPVVATFHGDTRSTSAVRLYEIVARVLGNFTRGVAAVSRGLERGLRRWIRAAPVAFVPNGLPPLERISPAERAAARERLGVQVPADEVVFIPSLPVRVHEVTGSVAAGASGSVMSVTDNQLSVDSQLPLEAAPLVKPGMKVAIDEQALGIKATGVVETVANTPGTRGVDGYHFYLGVGVESTPVNLAGFSVRLTIPIETSKGAVTAVPTSAVSLSADGTSRVLVGRGGTPEYVTVQPGLSTGGYVEVSAPDGLLVPGQLVVVGYKALDLEGIK